MGRTALLEKQFLGEPSRPNKQSPITVFTWLGAGKQQAFHIGCLFCNGDIFRFIFLSIDN